MPASDTAKPDTQQSPAAHGRSHHIDTVAAQLADHGTSEAINQPSMPLADAFTATTMKTPN